MGKDAPPPPDYAGAAREQAQSSREVTNMQTWANRPNLQTPWGSQTWQTEAVVDPATGQPVTRWSSSVNLTPEQQAALDAQQRIQGGRSGLAESLLGRAESEFGPTTDWSQFTPFSMAPSARSRAPLPDYVSNIDTSSLPQLDTTPVEAGSIGGGVSSAGLPGLTDASQLRDRVERSIYDRATSRLDPQWARRDEAARTRAYNMGLREGDEAYDNLMQDEAFERNDAYAAARNDAISRAGEEVSRQGQLELANRGQQFSERLGDAQLGLQGQIANASNRLATAQANFDRQRSARDSYLNDFILNAGLSNQARGAMFREDLAADQQEFGQEMQASSQNNSIRQAQIAEEMMRRGYTLNEINAILTGQQVNMPQMPSFTNAQRAEGVQALTAAQLQGQANLDAFSAQNAWINGLMGGAGSMVSAVKPFGF